MSYGVDIPDLFRKAATYADRTLRGEKPADLPVQRPTKFKLVVNLTSLNGEPDRRPAQLPVTVGDSGTGLAAAY